MDDAAFQAIRAEAVIQAEEARIGIRARMKPGMTLYRAEVPHHARSVVYEEWICGKQTPEGVWIRQFCGGRPKWVSYSTRFVSTTKEKALAHLQVRKSRYVMHSRRRYEEAIRQLAVAGGQPKRLYSEEEVERRIEEVGYSYEADAQALRDQIEATEAYAELWMERCQRAEREAEG